MISSKTLQLFLLGLVALSMNSISSANVITSPMSSTRIAASGIRGMRLLQQQQNDLEDDSADDDPSSSNESSRDTNKTSVDSNDNNNNNDSIDDEDDNRQRSGFVAPRARQCNTEQSTDEVEFECKSITTDSAMSSVEDELKFKVRANRGDSLKIVVKYETEVETAQSETETETQYTVVFDRLLEYRKVGNAQDDHYEWNVDEVVAEWPLTDWDPLSDLQINGADNRTVFSATTGMVTFTFTISQSDSDDLTTNKMKIDFLLENYPWDASGNTYVALISRIETEREIEIDGEDDGPDQVSDVLISFKDAVDTIGFVPFGEYSWATTAEATNFGVGAPLGNTTTAIMNDWTGNSTNGMVERSSSTGQNQTTTISVVASKSSSSSSSSSGNSTREEIAFSFVGAGQGANRIFWDPEAGIGYTSSASKNQFVASMILSAISMGLMALWL